MSEPSQCQGERVHGESPERVIVNPKPTDVTTVLKMSFRLVSRETHLRQFQGLSSSSGNACVLNLVRNQQSHLPIWIWNLQRERRNL
ncbi:hypothetical protein AHAS_Ahas08G0170700 [Arachis hypogaea]